MRSGPSRRSLPGWTAFVLGFLSVPLVALLFARLVAYAGDDLAGDTRHAAALAATHQLTDALDRFRDRERRLPTRGDGLAALVPTIINHVPHDPWGNPFFYHLSPEGHWADVVSFGADGLPGGTGEASDISGRFGSLRGSPPVFADALGTTGTFLLLAIGAFGAHRSALAAGLLAGIAALAAMLVLTIIKPAFHTAPEAALASLIALACMTGSVAVLRETPGARAWTVAAVLCAFALLQNLIAG